MKNKFRNLIICFFILFLSLYLIPSVLAKTRLSYLTSFVLDNEIDGNGFSNTVGLGVSYEATASALEILEHYGINPHEIEDLKSNLEDTITDMFDTNSVNLYSLYSLMKSLEILNHDIDTLLLDRIYQYLNDTEQVGGGFSYSNASTSVSLTYTYYVIQLYSLIDKPVVNITIHKDWILSCNNSDGGYGGNQSLTSTLINTYFATILINDMGNIDELADINLTLNYFKSYYINDTADLDNFGGFTPTDISDYALLSSTYYCARSLSLIEDYLGSSELNKGAISNWVLSRQNFHDGGFAENPEGSEAMTSSIISSYFAFETLNILGYLSSLNSEIWRVEFNYWILGIILSSIVLVIAAGIFLWRRRRI
ncbi:MAG: terpene cyclase/mutase family protein [Promethearchaeota archaeon]|nr:MAG: terpene cyclase/mutase family protein [Candidatus Lokiarchaeota archaeon]